MVNGTNCSIKKSVWLQIKVESFSWTVKFAVIESCPVLLDAAAGWQPVDAVGLLAAAGGWLVAAAVWLIAGWLLFSGWLVGWLVGCC